MKSKLIVVAMLLLISSWVQAMPFDPRTASESTINANYTLDNYYYWTPGTSINNRGGLFLSYNRFAGLLPTSEYSRDWFITEGDNVFIEYSNANNSADRGAYLSGRFRNARSTYFIEFVLGYDGFNNANSSYTGGIGELRLYNHHNNLLSTVDIFGRANGRGNETVWHAGASPYLSAWYRDNNGYIGDIHLSAERVPVPTAATAVSEPSVFVLFSLGLTLILLSARRRNQKG